MAESLPRGDRLLVVMRHGEAGRAASDSDRQLTRAGRAAVRRNCELLAQRVQPTRIISSPLLRARQTAEAARQILGTAGDVALLQELEPEGDCERVAHQLDAEAGIPLLVSHQPFVGRFVEYLAEAPVRVETGTIAVIRCEIVARGCGHLELLI